MAGSDAAARETDSAPEPEILSLRTQLVSAGHTKQLLAATDLMTLHIHCYGPKGGENGMHAHLDEDHVFLVLQGEAQFRGLAGPLPPVGKNQALFLPKGAHYSFSNEATEPLVMARFGATEKGVRHGRRLTPDGSAIPGRGKQKGAIAPVLIDGAFFE
jgi:mannose-6-phosphate isomerase-like protein (cupin superfamily)